MCQVLLRCQKKTHVINCDLIINICLFCVTGERTSYTLIVNHYLMFSRFKKKSSERFL